MLNAYYFYIFRDRIVLNRHKSWTSQSILRRNKRWSSFVFTNSRKFIPNPSRPESQWRCRISDDGMEREWERIRRWWKTGILYRIFDSFSFTCNENIKLFLKSDDFLIRIKLTVSTFELILTGFRRRKSRIKILTAILEKTSYPKLCMSDIEKLFTMTFED